jgi:hypothetical protein
METRGGIFRMITRENGRTAGVRTVFSDFVTGKAGFVSLSHFGTTATRF